MHTAVGIVLIVAVMTCAGGAQHQPSPTVWDGVYAKVAPGTFEHNRFLERITAGRRPGRALDIGIGEGRNAFFLASQGWDVTGFDVSATAIKATLAAAAARRLKVTAVVGGRNSSSPLRDRSLVVDLAAMRDAGDVDGAPRAAIS
jgi:methylase of polypeptide subunit release factors